MKNLMLTVAVFGTNKAGHILKDQAVTMQFVSDKSESVRQTCTRILKQGGVMPAYSVEDIKELV